MLPSSHEAMHSPESNKSKYGYHMITRGRSTSARFFCQGNSYQYYFSFLARNSLCGSSSKAYEESLAWEEFIIKLTYYSVQILRTSCSYLELGDTHMDHRTVLRKQGKGVQQWWQQTCFWLSGRCSQLLFRRVLFKPAPNISWKHFRIRIHKDGVQRRKCQK